ncbi:MAG: T9SS type A sorting domain-containing protein, partial [Saprospiraceae bacterium]|nr:T9SS type A sorting domain-containing protein [Saprospiraceae bacterium]
HFDQIKPNPMGLGDDRSDDCGSNARTDSIDILNYAVTLDLTKFSQQTVTAACEITFTAKQDGLGYLPLDLLKLTVDSVVQNGLPLVYDYNDTLLNLHLSTPVNIGQTAKVTVYYHGKPTADPSGFGGFVFAGGYAYNLGIGLSSNPYNFGRSWHPCFDNFVERATYDIHLISTNGQKGYAVGEFLGQSDLGGGIIKRSYRMGLPLPTYLVGSATSNYAELNGEHTGIYGTYPTLLVGKPGDTTQMKTAFQYLPQAIDALEAWFGPYRWGQVGYVLTSAGAMEHSTLIAFPDYSIDGGANYGMNRLMAHELGHHWWGNVTTLSCPFNMWIKEGNAEYSSHLFQEFAFGKEYFKDVVKDNNLTVIKTAHVDDDGYWPLSGLPYDQTYGTHTYQKGAAIMHNLRGYLGDSLFQQGMTSILDTYEYQSVDAELFRDQLISNTGVDMNPFFDDWIFSPGYALYELDSVKYAPSGNSFEARLFVQQKLHHAPHFHTNAPMEITFFDENWQTHTERFMTNGEYSEAVVNVPFQPVWQVLNDNNLLNLGRMQDRKVVNSTGNIGLQYCDLSNFQTTKMPAGDSALVSCIHYLGAADPDPSGIQLSSTHYWRFGGILPAGYRSKVIFNYRGSSANDLDHDLTAFPEDSLTLVWRPRPGVAWGHYPYYKKFALTANDGNGFMRVDTLLPGDYAFAAGSLPLATGVFDAGKNGEVAMAVYPNPATYQVTLQATLPVSITNAKVALCDAMGRALKQVDAQAQGGLLAQTLDISALQVGVYYLKILDESGGAVAVEKFIKN